MTAGNDNYETVEKDRWVTVYARETDENGVKYEFDETTQTYGVSGYAGSATEVNVPGTFSDGANGEKSVTYVKSDAFKDTNVIKKIVFPMSVTTLKGLAINSERDFRKTQQKIQNNIENSLQMIA